MTVSISQKYSKLIFVLTVFLIFTLNLSFVFFEKTITGYLYLIVFSSIIYFVFAIFLKNNEISIRLILSIAIAIFITKLFMIGVNPIGSDDYYRYLWDGKVLVNGINPFQFAPNSPGLKNFHSDLLPGLVTYPSIKTIYFPISQFVFGLSYLISGESIIGLKIILLITDLLITYGFYLTLRKKKLSAKFLLLYTLCPLFFFQFFVDAHFDLIGIMFFVYTLYFYDSKKVLAAIFLGASLAVKPTFIITIPFFFLAENNFKDKIKWLVIPLLFLFISFIPFSITANPFETLVNFSKNWTFNGAVYNLLSIFLTKNFTIRFILLLIFIINYLLILAYNKNLISSIYYSLILLLIFSPIVHPWYVTWIIVPLIFNRKKSGLAFLLLVSVSFYTVFIYQTTGIWNEFILVLILEYLPVTFLLCFEFFKSEFFRNKFYSNVKIPLK